MSCKNCPKNNSFIPKMLMKVDRRLETLIELLAEQPKPGEKLRDADYVMDRVGISLRTLFRQQAQGAIPIAETVGRRRFYRDEDVERFRKHYRE